MVRLVMEPTGLRIKRFVHPLPTLSLGARVGSGGGGAVTRLLRTSENDTTMSGLSKRGPSPPLAPGRQSLAILLHTKLQQAPNQQILILCASGENGK